MSPLVFRVRDEFFYRVLDELKARRAPFGESVGYGLDYADQYQAFPVLDGLVMAAWCGNPIGNTVQSGIRVVGTRPLRLLCSWLAVAPPRRLRGDMAQPILAGDDLQALFDGQLATRRDELQVVANRWSDADDVLAFALAIDELFGREWALQTRSVNWHMRHPYTWAGMADWLYADGAWGAAGFSRIEAERLGRLGATPESAAEWYQLFDTPLKGEATPGSRAWQWNHVEALDQTETCMLAGADLAAARHRKAKDGLSRIVREVVATAEGRVLRRSDLINRVQERAGHAADLHWPRMTVSTRLDDLSAVLSELLALLWNSDIRWLDLSPPDDGWDIYIPTTSDYEWGAQMSWTRLRSGPGDDPVISSTRDRLRSMGWDDKGELPGRFRTSVATQRNQDALGQLVVQTVRLLRSDDESGVIRLTVAND